MKYLSIFIRVALLALGQSLDCHSASEVSLMDMGQSMYNHNKAQQSKNRVHISWDILYTYVFMFPSSTHVSTPSIVLSEAARENAGNEIIFAMLTNLYLSHACIWNVLFIWMVSIVICRNWLDIDIDCTLFNINIKTSQIMWHDEINSWNKNEWQIPPLLLFGKCIYVWRLLLRTIDTEAIKRKRRYIWTVLFHAVNINQVHLVTECISIKVWFTFYWMVVMNVCS